MTMRYALTYVLVCALGCGLAVAQPAMTQPSEPQEKDDALAEASEQDAPADEEKEPEKTGDIITLKTGRELHGVQIIDEDPRELTIQVVEGATPMKLQRKFVKSVVYDKENPSRKKRAKPASTKLSVITGKKVSDEFGKKLGQPLSDEALIFKQMGFMRLVRQLAEKVNVTYEITEATKSIPMEERKRDFNIKPKTSLFSFLQEDFATAYPKLEAVYLHNKLVITTKEDAKAMAAKKKQDQEKEQEDARKAPPAPDAPPNS